VMYSTSLKPTGCCPTSRAHQALQHLHLDTQASEKAMPALFAFFTWFGVTTIATGLMYVHLYGF